MSPLAAAGAASAQAPIDDRIDAVVARVDRGVADGSLTPVQADQLRSRLWWMRHRLDSLNDAGRLNTWRLQDLNARLDRIASDVSRDRYFARYGTFRGYRQAWEGGG